jgi:hypothetical protein
MSSSKKQQSKKKKAREPLEDRYEPEYRQDGSENPRFRSLTTVDKELAGQAFICFSHEQPFDHIKRREVFVFEEFVRQWEFRTSMTKFHDFLQFMAHKHGIAIEPLLADYEEFVKSEQDSLRGGVEGDYKTFVENEGDKVNAKFNKAHSFQTSVTAIKFRGAFPSKEEAELRAEMLNKEDPDFSTFVGPAGTWLLAHPDINKMQDVRFLNEEMNRLMHEKGKNDRHATQAFDQRVRESKEHAIEDNKKNAEKFGSSRTQDIDEFGNLVDMRAAKASATASAGEDAAESLFDGKGVVTTAGGDNGKSQLTNNPFT